MSQWSVRRQVGVTPRTFATILGALGVLAGVLLLLLPVSATVDGQSYGCGSPAVAIRNGVAFGDVLANARQGDVIPVTTLRAACSAARDSRGTPGWTALGLGVATVAGARFVRWSGRAYAITYGSRNARMVTLRGVTGKSRYTVPSSCVNRSLAVTLSTCVSPAATATDMSPTVPWVNTTLDADSIAEFAAPEGVPV